MPLPKLFKKTPPLEESVAAIEAKLTKIVDDIVKLGEFVGEVKASMATEAPTEEPAEDPAPK